MKRVGLHRVLSILGLVILLAAGAFVLLRWSSLPDQVATHYGVSGQIDGWGEKSTLFTLMMVSLVLYGLVSAANVVPISIWNVNKGNTEKMRLLLSMFRLVLALGFAYIIVCSALGAALGGWFIPVFVGGLIVTFAGAMATANGRAERKNNLHHRSGRKQPWQPSQSSFPTTAGSRFPKAS